ncbi:uncharacterized protein LOC125680077 [Ostrea edulis]|uniref:uncharacterized protein LOC125680077 n=1 Tax=Ostrea edulis TaxID=37623 RepID=UPI0024AEF5CD|nr:uncharacterized protein LOC125680077 [Ostrea edulis]
MRQLAVLLNLLALVYSWVNEYDRPFTFTCPQHQSVHRVVSHHDNGKEDRVFDFQCSSSTTDSESCFWTDYVNDFDHPVVFQCPHGGVLDGVSSYHSNHNEDRRFRFYCCEKPGMCLYNCFYSGWANSYDGDLDYTVPAGHVMRGWTSIHDNGHEDRVFDFDVCLMQQCVDIGNPGESVIGRRQLNNTTTPFFIHLFLGVDSWVNDYDKPFTFTCPQHQSIHRVVSHHENRPEDRVFDFQCSPYAANSESCFWSGYVNNFDKPVAFQCPNGGILDGVSSFHDNGAEDRRFRFYCCEKPATGNMHLVTVFFLLRILGVYTWVNEYDQPFTFTCPQHQSISRVVSHHDNRREDRVFDLQCTTYTEKTENCSWTDFVNNFDQPLAFQCPNGAVLDGIGSYHDNHQEDRRFKFYCCEKPGMCLYNCFYSGWANKYDGDLDYTVPAGHVMRGMVSVHDNGPEDRIFDFDVCLMQECIDV